MTLIFFLLVQLLRRSFRGDEVVVPQIRHVGDAFKHRLLCLAMKGAILTVYKRAQPSVAYRRKALASGTFQGVPEGRPLVSFETGGVRNHALAGPTVIDPELVRGMVGALRRCIAFAVGAAHSQAGVQSGSEMEWVFTSANIPPYVRQPVVCSDEVFGRFGQSETPQGPSQNLHLKQTVFLLPWSVAVLLLPALIVP